MCWRIADYTPRGYLTKGPIESDGCTPLAKMLAKWMGNRSNL
jgi:hypothetical protein